MSGRAQQYILNSDDVLMSGVVTSDNKSNLIAGGLFDDLIATEDGEPSGNFIERQLYDDEGTATANWDLPCLLGDWCVTGNLTVTGNVSGTMSLCDMDLSCLDTDAVVEGDFNYYFTQNRFSDTLETSLLTTAPLDIDRAGNIHTLSLVENGSLTGDWSIVEASPGIPGSLSMSDGAITEAELKDYSITVTDLGDPSSASDVNIDLGVGNVQTITISTSTKTLKFVNPSAAGRACQLEMLVTDGGSQTVVWDGTSSSGVKWEGGIPPALTTEGVDWLRFVTVDGGVTWYGVVLGLDLE